MKAILLQIFNFKTLDVVPAIDLFVSFEPRMQPIKEMDGYIECEAVNSIWLCVNCDAEDWSDHPPPGSSHYVIKYFYWERLEGYNLTDRTELN